MTISKIPKKYREAHDATFANWLMLKRSKMCGCIFCCRIYPASDVVDCVMNKMKIVQLFALVVV